MSANIKFICTSFRSRQKSKLNPLTSYSGLQMFNFVLPCWSSWISDPNKIQKTCKRQSNYHWCKVWVQPIKLLYLHLVAMLNKQQQNQRSTTNGATIVSIWPSSFRKEYIESSNPVHGKVYSIQHYVIKFVSDLQQVGGFLHQ